MIGESPILPYFLLVSPPVEVAEAKLPKLSQATAPTVPNFLSPCSPLSLFNSYWAFGLNSEKIIFLLPPVLPKTDA